MSIFAGDLRDVAVLIVAGRVRGCGCLAGGSLAAVRVFRNWLLTRGGLVGSFVGTRRAVRRENGELVMASFKETRQGVGFPDWVIVRGSARLFDWYPEDSITELGFAGEDGREIRLAVSDYNRKVIRAEYVGGGAVGLYAVAGLVRRFYGSACYGHTDYFVAVA